MLFRMLYAIATASLICAAGCAEKRPISNHVTFALYAASATEADGMVSATVHGTERIIYRSKSPLVTNSDVAFVSDGYDAHSNPAVYLGFTPDGAKKMQAYTSNNQGKLLAVVVDGNTILALPIKSTISSSALISGMKGMTADKLFVLLTAATVTKSERQ